jgi:hypothetical protein
MVRKLGGHRPNTLLRCEAARSFVLLPLQGRGQELAISCDILYGPVRSESRLQSPMTSAQASTTGRMHHAHSRGPSGGAVLPG